MTGLDYADPTTDPHNLFGQMKLLPAIRPLLEGGKMIKYGAKAIPEGGLPPRWRRVCSPTGWCFDRRQRRISQRSAAYMGIHLAIKSGDARRRGRYLRSSRAGAQRRAKGALAAYEAKSFRASWAFTELHAARNFHAGFKSGLFGGMLNAALGTLTGGRGFGLHDKLSGHEGYARMRKLDAVAPRARERRVLPDNALTFDKVTDVFNSGTPRTDEN